MIINHAVDPDTAAADIAAALESTDDHRLVREIIIIPAEDPVLEVEEEEAGVHLDEAEVGNALSKLVVTCR
jgi:hypothetical protein